MRRLLIYLTYDKQNIIDDYIGYFLQTIRPIADTIAVVCNMPRIEKGLSNLTAHADHIFYRENTGLDAGGFKDALCTLIGWDRLQRYDELILANDSFYGPFADISRIFTGMESRSLDFWGLMKRGAGAYGATGSDPAHILSFFYVFQAPLLHSREFREYWETMPYYNGYMEVVKRYERQLTKHFADQGYSWDAYADTEPNETANLKNQFFQCDYLAYEMIRKRNFPFLKRKQMTNNTLFTQTQENIRQSLDYIESHTDYDVELIWKNLIRTQHHTRLFRSLGLQFILGEAEEKKHVEAAVYVRADWSNAAEYVCEYLEKIRDTCDIYIFTGRPDIRSYYCGQGFEAVVSDSTDIEILLEADREKYRYICLVHDMDLSSDRIPACTGKSLFFNVWENLVKDERHVLAVADLLDQKKHIGMLMHPVPFFAGWTGSIGNGWREKYGEVEACAGQLKLNAVLDPAVPPVHATGNFWIRNGVLGAFSSRHESVLQEGGIPEEILPYLWNYIMQDSGYLTGIVESSLYASMDRPNCQHYLTVFAEWLTKRYGPHAQLHEFQELFFLEMAVERCRKEHKSWYVYGTGEMAERGIDCLQDASAFVVSDGNMAGGRFHGKPVIGISELEAGGDFGIVLCLSRENQDAVLPLLEERGIRNYYTVC